jgi:nitronate monooxygenase
VRGVDVLDRLRLDVPVGNAGMGGGLAGPELAAAVAAAGGLGTLGLAEPAKLPDYIKRVRDAAPDRAIAVNLLMPFVRRAHVEACVKSGIDVAVLGFGGGPSLVAHLRDAGVMVLAMVGTRSQARDAVGWGADGLIAQGGEAGGHLSGRTPALEFLPQAIALAGDRPVLLAGGIATAADVRAALTAGASAVVAGTRFLLTRESRAHAEYQRWILAAEMTYRTTLFGFGWPAPHRVVPNAATQRWCRDDGSPKVAPRLINAPSGLLSKAVPDKAVGSLLLVQSPRLPLFSPVAPIAGMPDEWVDRSALYAGESVLRMESVVPAREALMELAGR